MWRPAARGRYSAPVIAHKFGGSSVASAERIARVVDILLARPERQVVVISAMQGVTDALIALVQRAAARDDGWAQAVNDLERRHLDTAATLLGSRAEPVQTQLRAGFAALRDLLRAQAQLGAESPDLLALIAGLGEVWSSTLVDAAVRARGAPSTWLDARDVLVVDATDLGAAVVWDRSQQLAAAHLASAPPRTIVTGYVARHRDGRITNLGRNGSDYSGAIFAALFMARELHVWSDVDGVLSADPRLVPEAVHIPKLSYAEACELAYFGAKVLHPQTMAPAIERGIPIVARNTFRPEHPGTRIAAEVDLKQPVKGVTTFQGLAILDLEGAGMIGVPGTAERAFAALKQARVSVVMISQGSSEHSICCVIREAAAEAARHALLEEFGRELANRQISGVTVVRGIAALAVVGDGMAGRPGTAARLFAALARANVNVRLIAQGASERNISVAIDATDAGRALRAVHAGYYLSPQTISIGLVGPGHVGKAFLRQLHAARPRLLQQNLDLRVRAVAGSRQMQLLDTMLAADAEPAPDRETDLMAFAAHVQADHLPHAVVVDCSASDGVADHYEPWLRRGIHVITPNKHAGSGPLERWRALRRQPGQWRYEATVGAGLPILTTLRDLLDTGDELLAIEGSLSGTLAYLLHHFDGREPFAALVRRAMELGYTEPDPRDDLSGRDVARKLVILARECGWSLAQDRVQLESLVPEALRKLPRDEFVARLGELDDPLATRLAAARAAGGALRYTARLEAGGKATVGLAVLPPGHALVTARPTDNVVQFTTRRYRDNPLVVQGPGAGPEVTAAGVFADLLRLCASLGARL
ncbi:MAG: bifunctional aspartate kinase/homoserine dehydrogenase I [Planctomycetes bacterium]|nr:bifunctional aspartate kinase/homoserine dehydrogenase I [Planctomycetota bacterium]